ncbi:GH116 family glycosyl hydrolase [Thermoflexus sp.]|uniref:amylo-alpha-1,6-glucosidase n=1 Tax=Thermoflexus sp. TaxID=1969742 RepID=UPI0025DED2BB|nr:GH116 family glycosyl hydrolase [Thermoflexus sp.]MDW8179964.1 GH116 family glycosyl hydrolase [Anaerolineae bacterium]MCS6962527.1 GH116 family glycosyl hydrolase [Thermoflexus sp.]MCS7350513.1 GH116 family glycosyl hydrolase [Thermoflexus sp.]MCX7690314.1 GH116 family glycosyl hydrolase [Thermoflexus sp.]MDW8183634.1 GH116 family glycosyl hydrolase [Anaerolineae bacterium]
MRVFPQPDGALRIEDPDAHVLYDMGNPRLFVRFDGRGHALHLLLADGFYAGAWELDLTVDQQAFRFREGRAIGRRWTLEGASDGLEVRLSSFISEEAPGVFQVLTVRSRGDRKQGIGLRIHLRFTLPTSWRDRWRSALAQRIPRWIAQPRWWSEGWAKGLLPPAPERVQIFPGGWIRGDGRVPLRWVSSIAPGEIRARGREVDLRWDLPISPGETVRLAWGMVAGSTENPTAEIETAHEAALRYEEWLSRLHRWEDPLLQSLFVAGLNTAIAMYKSLPDGFAGLVAGPDYAYPPRLYFRDGYWTAQALLFFRPEWVRRHLLSIARGIGENGACPSGVFAPHLLHPEGPMPGGLPDWLPDHLDAPAFLVLLVHDYLRVTEDWQVLEERVPSLHTGRERPLWAAARSALMYLISRDSNGDGLVEKPDAPNDWADNVRRGTWVTYDQALYVAALRAGCMIARALREERLAEHLASRAWEAQRALNTILWDPARGHYVNYRRPNYVEDHFSIDTLVTLLYGLAEREQAHRILAAARSLQTRYNPKQPYGDWGVMSVFPLYRNRRDLFGRSAHPYRYHNGADWPYWDGVYGWLLLQREDPDWKYVLTRWWSYSLENGWLTPVEYYSPPYPRGGLLQGWSAMPAAALLWGKERICPPHLLALGGGAWE